MPQGNFRPVKQRSPFSAILYVVMIAFVIYMLFFIAKGIFSILAWASPVLLIASFFLDKTVIPNFIKYVFNKLKTDTVTGIVMVLLSIFAFPILSGYLFSKSLLKNRLGKKLSEFEAKEKGEYAEYEVVEDDDDFLKLPELEKSSSSNKNNTKSKDDGYEELFD